MKTKTFTRAALLLSAVVVALAWTTSSTGAAGQSRPGIYLDSNGFRSHLYGSSSHLGADGVAVVECGKLTAPQVEAARIGRQLSRAMMALSPQAVVNTDGGAQFEVTYTDAQGAGFNDAAQGATRRKALEASLAAWSKVIKTTIPIKVAATMHKMDDGDNNPDTMLLANAGATQYWSVDGVTAIPSSLTWQLINGREPSADASDISVNVNDQVDWDYTLTGNVPRGHFSFVYTLMHEIGHGLGIADSLDQDTGKYLNDPLMFVYDTFLNRGSAKKNTLRDHAEEERTRDMRSDDLYFNGEHATVASKKSIQPLPMVKLYAPAEYAPGSSIGHVDQRPYEDVRVGLMTPIDFGAGTDRIDILTLGIINDLGYTMVPNPPLPPNSIPGTTTRVPQ